MLGKRDGAGPPDKSHPVLFRSKADIFAFIATQRSTVSVASLCRLYQVTRAGFYRCALDVHVAVPFPGAPCGNQQPWDRGWHAGLT